MENMNYKEIHTISELKNIENTIVATQLCKNAGDTDANMWILSFSPSITHSISATKIRNFIQTVIRCWQQQITVIDTPISVTFYMWFDEQVGHLCFNLLFASKHDLPFGCTIRFVSIDTIIDSFLTSTIQGGIVPFSEISEVSENCHTEEENDDDEQDFILDVYAVTLNQNES